MVKGVEDLRTPLSTILHLETQLRGSIAGFMMPQFVVDVSSSLIPTESEFSWLFLMSQEF